ncbi:MAG: 50S ribosomal protein L9 [Candidatus Bathyarchaeia archaeon]
MEVILLEDVPSLGKAGQVVRVKEGYARNYLIPKGLAEPATSKNITRIKERQKLIERKLQREKERAQGLAEKLAGIKCVIKRSAGVEGKLFGAVTPHDIEVALREMGIEVDRKRIELKEPIRHLGSHTVYVRLHSEVKVPLEVWVEKED